MTVPLLFASIASSIGKPVTIPSFNQLIVADTPVVNGRFGSSVSCDDNAIDVIIGASTTTNPGAVMFFQRQANGSYDQVAYFQGTDLGISSGSQKRLGYSVRMSGDGNVALATASYTGINGDADVAIFRKVSGTWGFHGFLTRPGTTQWFGGGNVCGNGCIDYTGEYLLVGDSLLSSNRGACYMYHWNGSSYDGPVTLDVSAYSPAVGDFFGECMAMANTVGRFIVAARGKDILEGEVYIGKITDATTFAVTQVLNPPTPSVTTEYGKYVSMSKDGLWVGVSTRTTQQNWAYIYQWNPGTEMYDLYASVDCNTSPLSAGNNPMLLSNAGVFLTITTDADASDCVVYRNVDDVWTPESTKMRSDYVGYNPAFGTTFFGFDVAGKIDGSILFIASKEFDLTAVNSNEGAVYAYG